MSNQGSENTRGKIDWKRKGLGWIPDYPDIRDYQLNSTDIQKSGRLKRDEITGSIESLAKTLIDTLKAIEKNAVEGFKKEDLQNSIEALENRVFGDISFATVKFHKILRKGIQDPIILEVKKCLNILRQFEFIDPTIPDLTKPQKLLDWLSKDIFDDDTEFLVKAFQKKIGICEQDQDGVVGLEVYTALRDCFLHPEKLEHASLSRQFDYQTTLIPVPSLLPREFFEILLMKLESFAIHRLRLQQIQIPEINSPNLVLQAGYKKFLNQYHPSDAKYFSKRLKKLEEDPSHVAIIDLDQFIEVFHNEFSILDPIISTIIQIISPLAQYKDLEMAFEVGFKELVSCLENKSEDSKKPEFKELMVSAIQVSGQLFDPYVRQIVAEENQQDRVITLYFYFLLDQLLHPTSNCQETVNQNFFRKKELFEIEPPISEFGANKIEQKQGSCVSFLPLTTLQIPVANSLYKTKRWQVKRSKKYLFLPGAVDLSFWCSEVEDQKNLDSCTAFAGIALIEYFANRSLGGYIDASPLFLYKATRNLMNLFGDTGASVRETMKAMALFGVPPNEYWPYEEELVNEEPPAFCYSFAQNYQALKYFRLDYSDIPEELLLCQVKAVLAAGFPCIFGLTLYSSAYEDINITNGFIPVPHKKDRVVGGHALVAVGYSDYKKVEPKSESRGAILVRNSWGTQWGQQGYGWLPYEYILKGLTADWWSLLKSEWFDKEHFGLGAKAWSIGSDSEPGQPDTSGGGKDSGK